MKPLILGLALVALVACTREPAAPQQDTATEAAEKPDPRMQTAAAGQQEPGQKLSGTLSTLSGSMDTVAGNVSPLQGLVDALGGAITDREIRIALPADTLFEFDKADVLPAAETNLRLLAELIGKTEGTVQVNGYTDAKGDDAYNLALSKRRADAAKAWLVTNGVPEARLQAVGFGEADPVAPNETQDGKDDPDGRAKNRRVEVVIPKPADATAAEAP